MSQAKKILLSASAFIDNPDYFGPLADAGYEVGHTEDGPLSPERLIEVLPGHIATIAAVDTYNDEVLSQAKDLRIISRWGVGLDSVDVEAATKNGIVVCYTPGMVSSSVADMTFALMLHLARHLTTCAQRGKSAQWSQDQAADVFGTTLGLIGFGSIGQAVAYRARGFDMRVLAFDPYPNQVKADELGVQFADIDTIVREADFLSLHCNLTDENHHLIGADQLAVMKATAYLINTARGGLVDTAALQAALENDTIAGAALDTLEEEPPSPDMPILCARNCLVTPHASFYNTTSVRLVNTQVVQNILDVLSGKVTEYVVNPQAL